MTSVPINPHSIAFRDAWQCVRGSVEYGIFDRDDPEVRDMVARAAAHGQEEITAPRVVRAIAPAHVRNGNTAKALVPLEDGDDVQAAKHYALCMLGWLLKAEAQAERQPEAKPEVQ